MDTQNTPIHVRLWHRGFWFLALANLLLTLSVYMMIPVLPSWLMELGIGKNQAAGIMGVYGIGLYVLGPFCNYWVQRYRRNHVCRLAILGMIASYGVFYVLANKEILTWLSLDLTQSVALTGRLMLGATFGLAQMVLCSTLIIDTSESFKRTEANHAAAWFGRFSLSLGPLAGLVLGMVFTTHTLFLVMGALSLAAILLIQLVDFPFKAPEENMQSVCLDRFFLPEGWLLFVNLMFITIVIGMLLSMIHSVAFYALMMGGFLLALLAERFVFPDADLKSEVLSGLIVLGAALLIMLHLPDSGQALKTSLPPVFMGFGSGIIGSRFQLFFIKLSRHCQRGTSQSSFFLAWESGISIGLFVGIAFFSNEPGGWEYVCHVGIFLTVVNLLVYHFFTHPWFIRHKNR